MPSGFLKDALSCHLDEFLTRLFCYSHLEEWSQVYFLSALSAHGTGSNTLRAAQCFNVIGWHDAWMQLR